MQRRFRRERERQLIVSLSCAMMNGSRGRDVVVAMHQSISPLLSLWCKRFDMGSHCAGISTTTPSTTGNMISGGDVFLTIEEG